MTQPRHTEGATDTTMLDIQRALAAYGNARATTATDTATLKAELLAQIEAAIGRAALSGWQPIETAPKDGSTILLGRAASEELDSDAISVPGYWQEGYEDGVDYMGCDSGFVDSPCQVFSGGRSFGSESHCYAPNQPTHWQPLPTPPAPNQGAES